MRALSVYHGPTWTVEHAVLVESRLGAGPGGGPLYTDLATLPLWQDDGHGAAPRTGE